MTLEESTAWALAAAKAGNPQELQRALEARRAAIAEALASGQAPQPHILAQVVDAGERVCSALQARKRELTLESARLRLIQHTFSLDGFARPEPRANRISLRG